MSLIPDQTRNIQFQYTTDDEDYDLEKFQRYCFYHLGFPEIKGYFVTSRSFVGYSLNSKKTSTKLLNIHLRENNSEIPDRLALDYFEDHGIWIMSNYICTSE